MKKLALAALSVLLALAALMLRVDEPALVGGTAPAESARLVDDVTLKPVEEPAAERVASAPVLDSESISSSAAEGSTFGVLGVRIATADGTGVRGRVIVHREDAEGRRFERRVRVEETGFRKVKLLPAGEHLLEIDPDSLPPGVLPPWGQDRYRYSLGRPGFTMTAARVEAGTYQEVELLVFRDSSAHGYVWDPRGEPVANVFVRFQSILPGMEGLSPSSRTDHRGYYEIDGGLYPGPYRARVIFDPGMTYPSVVEGRTIKELSLPPPQRVDVLEASSQRVDVQLSEGTITLEGSVIDQDGSPVSDLGVRCYYAIPPEDREPGETPLGLPNVAATARTDERGMYRLYRVHADRVAVAVGIGDYSPNRSVGQNRLAIYAEPIYIDLRGRSGSLQLESRTVLLSRPFRIEGQVDLDPYWAAEQRVGFDDLKLLAQYEVVRRGRRVSRETRIPIDAGGRFEWACETPQDPVLLVVGARWIEVEPARLEVVPIPNETLSGARIVFPPE